MKLQDDAFHYEPVRTLTAMSACICIDSTEIYSADLVSARASGARVIAEDGVRTRVEVDAKTRRRVDDCALIYISTYMDV